MLNKLTLMTVALLLGGCGRVLTCRTEFLTPAHLASERVGTPDPARCSFYGQQLLVHWRLPDVDQPTTLFLYIRYGNRELQTLEIPILQRRGWHIHRLINEEYWCREGILSFKAEIYSGGTLLYTWTHYLWVELINL